MYKYDCKDITYVSDFGILRMSKYCKMVHSTQVLFSVFATMSITIEMHANVGIWHHLLYIDLYP